MAATANVTSELQIMTNKMLLFWFIYLFTIRSTCFGRCLRPKQFHLIHDTSRQQYRWTISEAV